MHLKPFVAFLLCIGACGGSLAQGKEVAPDAAVSSKDFIVPNSPVVDSNTTAVILHDIGSIRFVGDRNGRGITYEYIEKVRLKLIKRSAFDAATVSVLLYGDDEYRDKFELLKASTYNIENGKIIETALQPAEVFDIKRSKYYVEKKFTMPALREGSVVDYSIKVSSHYYFDLPTWQFQYTDYPCLLSRFELETPDILQYLVSHTGIDSATVVSSDADYKNMMVGYISISSVTQIRQWTMTNIPALQPEPYMYCKKDYLNALQFRLASNTQGARGIKIPSWSSASKQLLHSQWFGQAILADNAGNLLNTMDNITAADNNLLDAAKHLYFYVRDNFTCIENNYLYLDNDLYTVNKKKKGSVAELNLLLIALLRQKGLKADPVILSTREFGMHPVAYPALDKMNYVIARLQLFGDTIYLDASDRQMPFGKLPLQCYNGHAKVIAENDSSDIRLAPEAVAERKKTTVFIQQGEGNALLSGTVEQVPGFYQSVDIRTQIAKEGLSTFLSNVKSGFLSDVRIENAGIDSLKQDAGPLTLHYDFHFASPGADNEIFYFNPLFFEAHKKNLFTADARKYPLQLDAPVNEMYVLSMEVPSGYEIEETPVSAKVLLNEGEGFYEYILQKEANNIQLRSHLVIKRTTFSPDEYSTLHNFFGYVVKKQAEQIVFKRKKIK